MQYMQYDQMWMCSTQLLATTYTHSPHHMNAKSASFTVLIMAHVLNNHRLKKKRPITQIKIKGWLKQRPEKIKQKMKGPFPFRQQKDPHTKGNHKLTEKLPYIMKAPPNLFQRSYNMILRFLNLSQLGYKVPHL